MFIIGRILTFIPNKPAMKKLSIQGLSQLLVFSFFILLTVEATNAQNSLQNKSRNIPTYFFGTVTDCHSGNPLSNISVTAMAADTFTTQTAEDGTYKLLVVPDTFDLIFSVPSMYKDTVFDTLSRLGLYTEVSTSLCEIPYAPAMVILDPSEDDTKAWLYWAWNYSGYEIIYDDGGAEDYVMWVLPGGGKSAVRFTPAGYPATVSGGRLYVGNGDFPVGADFLGTDMAVGILDDDGPDGMPGTVLDSIIVTVNNYYWVDFNGFNATFEEGDFYIVMWQLGIPPQAAPLGIDEELPTVYRSYAAAAGSDWTVSPYQDFMIRATVSNSLAAEETLTGSSYKLHSSENKQRELNSYDLVWIDGFDPNQDETPEDGTKHHFPGNESSPFLDTQWGPRDEGFYAYAARANYANDTSEWTYSIVAAHMLDNVVTITMEQCDDGLPDNIEVSLIGKEYPYQNWQGTATVIPADNQAEINFDSVIDGAYDLTVFKVGYHKYYHTDIQIFNDYQEYVILQENAFPATNLYVDSLTSVATWNPALITQLPLEDFEDEEFPPEGWQVINEGGLGWFHSDSNYAIPPGDGFYAVNSAPTYYGIGQYLITPPMDLRQSDDYAMYFDTYHDNRFGTIPFIEYSIDAGASWEVYNVLPNVTTEWTPMMVDLNILSGENGFAKVWIAFHYNGGDWLPGSWAIDNVVIHDGPAPIRGYYVYMNDGFIAEIPPEQTTYTYTDLVYGVTYKASVRAAYTCGLSAPIDYYFSSTYLYPPRNLGDAYLQDTNAVPLFWLPPRKMKEPESNANRDYPKYGIEESRIEYGTVSNTLAFNRSSAGDIVKESSGSRDYGDVVDEVSPQGVQLWGVCFDGEFLYVTDPFGSAGTVINQFNIDGSATGYTIDGSAGGASWVGDMASDGKFIYACNVDGDNAIKVYNIETGTLVNTITGAWTSSSQRGLAYDEFNFEFYIGGWNSNNIWRADENGGTIDDIPFVGVSGLAWHPLGGPTAGGSLWVETSTADDLVTETDPNAAWPMLQNFTIPSGAGFSGGGLGINSDGMLWVVNQSNGIIYLVDVEEPLGLPKNYKVPEGLIGFKVYQDNDWIADVAFNGTGVEDSIHYTVNALDPNCYLFDVSAIYDLEVFGFPGEVGESQLEGPDTICVAWGYELPFLEEWEEGSFAFNGWRLEGNAWVINSNLGNPEPSAEFDTDMLMENIDYSSTLTSNPLLGNHLTEGDIFLDFNLKLDDVNATGEEKLLVEVSIDAGNNWQQLTEFSNAAGSFDFEEGFQHINISNVALGHAFFLRFNATGKNSAGITGWFIDNIHVYHICQPPTGLRADYFWYPPIEDNTWGVEICWNEPEIPTPPALWIYWDNGVYAGGVGLLSGGVWSLAQRWDAGQLTDWIGDDLSNAQITKISFVLNDAGFNSVTLKIWSGNNASTLLYQQEVEDPEIEKWVVVMLDTPVDFDVNEELWIGYTVDQIPGNTFPAGYDEGPAVSGYGDMITTDGTTWDRISDFGIDNNWAIHAFVEELPEPTLLIPIVDKTVYSGKNSFSESQAVKAPIAAPATAVHNVSGFSAFNLYRKEIGVDEDYNLYNIIPWVEGLTSYCFHDTYPSVTADGQYCYKITATWVNDNYFCESDPAWNIEHTEDYVCVFVTGIGKLNESQVNLFPNPATNNLNISSTDPIRQITVFNYVGQVVFNQEFGGEKVITLNTSSFESGIYVVRVELLEGQFMRRVVITQ